MMRCRHDIAPRGRAAHGPLPALLVASALTAALALPARADSFARIGAANQDATGTPPGGATRSLVVGMGVVYKEKIQTSAQGSTQVLFPDSSTLNIGRNASVTIDEFVYDPKPNSGTMVATLAKGALRFVGGQISHHDGVTVKTPVATLGIRGGVASLSYPTPAKLAGADPNLAGCTGELVIGHVGAIVLRNRAGQATLRPGFATCVNGPDTPIPPPFRISDAALNIVVSLLTSGPGQNGGNPTPAPGPLIVGNTGTVHLDPPGSPPGSDPLGLLSIISGGDNTVKNRSQAGQLQTGLPPPQIVDPPPPVNTPTTTSPSTPPPVSPPPPLTVGPRD
ncbi:FecR domain-containing protein [Bradyrhizobium sp. WD16]|uniref:FecR family protein n=1 Tax=Bradyrhizobium sp. WD16 TaxID=1521768 RepID=UPI0020A2F4FE|nr:FecR domain-containing protein [Bradyrhizobium sp. WD16]